jgi:hypothetical protein
MLMPCAGTDFSDAQTPETGLAPGRPGVRNRHWSRYPSTLGNIGFFVRLRNDFERRIPACEYKCAVRSNGFRGGMKRELAKEE